jgi:Zn-dependent peptidase ImmA (M78 family)/DNA-binding XRE family transcriptional regulator
MTVETHSLDQLGNRLRLARVRADVTQSDAADQLGMARTTLVAIEKGERRVRPDELIALARLYHVTANELVRESAVHLDLQPRFRALPATQRARAEEPVALLNRLAASELELEQLLGRSPIRNYPPVRPILPGDIEQQAEEAALEFRHRLGRGLAPLKDLLSLLESEIGIRIFIRPFDRSISGLFAFDESAGACILLNENHTPARRLQSAAHEIGHFIATRHQPDVEGDHIPTNSREERFAKRFGFALLLPSPAARSYFAECIRDHGRFSPRHLVTGAHRFGVSNEAFSRRLEDLQLLPKGTWESLKDRGFSGEFAHRLLSSGDKSTDSAGPVTPRLWLLAAEAYERELVSEEQLAHMLHLSRIDIRCVLDTLDVEGVDDLRSVATAR